jgi:hypothetical protein
MDRLYPHNKKYIRPLNCKKLETFFFPKKNQKKVLLTVIIARYSPSKRATGIAEGRHEAAGHAAGE